MTKGDTNSPGNDTPGSSPDRNGALAEDFGGSSHAVDIEHQTKAPNETRTKGENGAPEDMPLEHAKAPENGVNVLENRVPGSSRDHNSATAEDISDDILDARRRTKGSNKRAAQDATIAGRNSKKRHM